MKALLVNEYPLGLPGSGGVEGHVAALASLLRDAGHEAIIVTGQIRGQPASHRPTHHRLPDLGGPPMRLNMPGHYRAQLRALRQVRALVQAERPDVIHLHNVNNALALHALRGMGPTVRTIHDCRPFCSKPRPGVATRLVGASDEFCDLTLGAKCWPRCYARAARRPRDLIEAWSFFPNNLWALREVQACDRIVVLSRYLRDLALAAGTPAHKLESLDLFTDAENTAIDPPPERLRDPSVLFAGRLVPEKGVLHLLDAIAGLPPFPGETLIAGDGPLHSRVAERALQLAPNRRIRLLGYLDRPALLRCCATSTLLAFPSIGSEGCPLTGIEAMYFGTPVVAFDVGGVREWLVDGVTGVLVPRNDVVGFGRAIATLLGDPARCQQMGAAARAYVRSRFRRDRHLYGLLSVYRRAQEDRQPRTTTVAARAFVCASRKSVPASAPCANEGIHA